MMKYCKTENLVCESVANLYLARQKCDIYVIFILLIYFLCVPVVRPQHRGGSSRGG